VDVSDFYFSLPDELIAQHAAPRGTSRLFLLDRSSGADRHGLVSDLPSWLRRGDLLVVNNTRVVAARLLGHRVPSGGAVECLLLGQPQRAGDRSVDEPGPRVVQALMHPGQKLKPGALVRFEGAAGSLVAEVLERHFHGRRTIRIRAEGQGDVDALIDALGHVPLPPYIKRADTVEDRERYQTVYARVRGSVAAPTAGLHFTPELLSALERHGVERTEITLHVGYGTFKPVRTEQVEEHTVEPEAFDIPPAAADAIARAQREGRRIIAVGTTTTRALEDAAARNRGRVAAGPGIASVFIYPGFEFRVVNGLLTNFHLPSSSLLMLVAAFGGRDRVLHAYRDAVERRYRFYSYGDAMLIL
jgi:S-adenosylmethionine:tRNA ribosyltransferase-isomerase